MVAANTRTFTLMGLSLPTRVISFSCNARSTFACADRLISPISSRNSVPPSACSNLPARSFIALVKLPFVCPNSSLSISSLGMAAQFTSTIGFFARLLFSCIICATTSLPVPLAPVIITRASVPATFSMISRTRSMAALSPTILLRAPIFLRSTLVSCTSDLCSSARWVVTNNLLRSNGLTIKSYAPLFSASTAVSTVPCPVIITTGASSCPCSCAALRYACIISMPSISGILMSV